MGRPDGIADPRLAVEGFFAMNVFQLRGGWRKAVLRSLFLWAVVVLSAGIGSVRADTPQPLTLNAAVQEALRANPNVQAATRHVAAAQQQTHVAKGQQYGELDAVLTAQHLNDAQLLRPLAGPITPAVIGMLPFAQDQIHAGVAYSFPLYVGGRISNEISIAELGTDRARALLRGTRSDIAYNVTALFAQAQALAAQAQAISQELDELNTTRSNLELAVKIGKRPEVDLLKTVDRISEAEADRTEVLAQQKTVLSALMALMGRDPSSQPTLAPLPQATAALTAGEDVLESNAANRSSVAAASDAFRQANRRVAAARSALVPNVFLQASYFEHTDASDLSSDTWFVGLLASYPVFDGGSRRAEVSRRREEEKAAQADVEAARLQAEAELQSALAGWRAAADQQKAASAQLAAAREVARIEQIKYDTGAGDIEDLLRARTREVGAESSEIAARARITVSGAQINRVTENEVVR